MLFVGPASDQVDVRKVFGADPFPLFLPDSDVRRFVENGGIGGERHLDGLFQGRWDQCNRRCRVAHCVEIRRVVENLDVAADGIFKRAFEGDEALLGDLQPRLGLQNVDRDAGAPLNPFVFQVELFLDVLDIADRKLDQASLAQDAQIGANASQQGVLARPLQRQTCDLGIEARNFHVGSGFEAVEQVLGDGQCRRLPPAGKRFVVRGAA